MEQTFVMVKPDGVQRGLVGEIVSRFERKGLKIVAAKLFQVPKELAEQHYAEHASKPFFAELVDFITSGPVFAMVIEGNDCIKIVREMMGKTNPADSAPGTIRGDYGLSIGMNIIHGSDSTLSATREIKLWFDEKEICTYDKTISKWL